ncbi:hypothetical protein BDC45DRAFT_557366 [Circinella umbellata]|nr:hypothetical protein BDC45DRAFT_557366 [Circinella umbellata]
MNEVSFRAITWRINRNKLHNYLNAIKIKKIYSNLPYVYIKVYILSNRQEVLVVLADFRFLFHQVLSHYQDYTSVKSPCYYILDLPNCKVVSMVIHWMIALSYYFWSEIGCCSKWTLEVKFFGLPQRQPNAKAFAKDTSVDQGLSKNKKTYFKHSDLLMVINGFDSKTKVKRYPF